MLNHDGNSYIARRKHLCHPADTVMSHRIQLYHPLVYLFCILIRSGSRSNVAVAKQSKRRSGIIKRNKESASSLFHFIWLRFYLKMSHNIYHMSSRATIPEYQPLGYTKDFGIGWHNAPGLSCHLGADILVCHPRSRVIYVYLYPPLKRSGPEEEEGFVSCLVEIGTVVLEKTTGYFQISSMYFRSLNYRPLECAEPFI